MKDFRKLKVWKKAHELALAVYSATQDFPKEERYGLTSQLRRSGASVPSNIAEGCGRATDADMARFCDIAAGSASELQYQLLLAHDLDLIDGPTHKGLNGQTTEVKRMLSSLISTLRGIKKE